MLSVLVNLGVATVMAAAVKLPVWSAHDLFEVNNTVRDIHRYQVCVLFFHTC